MFDIQVNERGQITIPKELREKVNINPRDNLKIDIDEQGRLILFKKDLLYDLEDLIRRDLINEGYFEVVQFLVPQKLEVHLQLIY